MRSAVSRMITCLCVLLVLAVPILVRSSTATFPNMTEEERSAYTDEQGRYYLTDQDSYYHVRIVDNHLATGQIGDSRTEDGIPRDTRSFYPEGRGTDYAMGIVLLTEAVWKPLNAIFGTGLYEVEYCLSAILAALAGLAAYLLTRRISGHLGGVVGGILTACAPAYVLRTMFSRFDTDMFVVLMDVLLILFLTESLRAKTGRKRIGFATMFVLTAWIYSQCWNAAVVTAIAGITLFGGLIWALWYGISRDKNERREGGSVHWYKNPAIWIIIGCGIVMLGAVFLTEGPKLISSASVTASTVIRTGNLPSMYTLVSEMSTPPLIPANLLQWIWDPKPGKDISLMSGVGGAAVMILGLGGLIWLAIRGTKRFNGDDEKDPGRAECRMYACILLVTLVSWAFLVRYGFRFVEHLAVPLGILAGTVVGWIGAQIRGKDGKMQWARAGLCAVLAIAAVVPAVADSIGMISGIRPGVSRVSDDAMRWVRENAEDPDAVIASWWDNGYYYEAASGHPCLWDGGTTDSSVRAMLFSKAMASHDLELSRRILLMLSGSGNRAAEYLMERMDTEMAFDTVWDALMLEKAEAEELIVSRCGLTREEAAEAEALLHPEQPKETYLIITDTMMMEIGWYEYFAFWDFAGDNPVPRSTTLRYTPDGYPYDSPEGQIYMDEIREDETIWRLYMEEIKDERFELVFSGEDASEGLWMWRVSQNL